MAPRIGGAPAIALGVARRDDGRYTRGVQIQLYTRRGCHLCDEAKSLLVGHGLSPVEIDIDADPALVIRYTRCVPVVVVDGKVRFRGGVSPVLLRRLLRKAAAPNPSTPAD